MAILPQHDLGFTVNIWCLMLQKLQGFFFFFFTSSTNIDSLQLCCMKKIPMSFQCRLSLSLLTPAVIDVQTAPAFPYLMCTRLSLMPTFEANRSEPGGGKSRGEWRRFEGKWKAWPKRKKQIRGEADGVREEFGKCLIRRLDSWCCCAFCSDGNALKYHFLAQNEVLAVIPDSCSIFRLIWRQDFTWNRREKLWPSFDTWTRG